MADSQGNEVIRVEGGTPPSIASTSNAIRSEARRLNSDLASYEAERAKLEVSLTADVTDKQRAALQARLANVTSNAAQTTVILNQLKAQYQSLNAVIAQRTAAAIAAAAPPPPAPPAPPAPGGGGGGFFGGLTSAGLTSIAAQYLSIYAAFRLIREAASETLDTLKSWAEAGIKTNEQFELMRAGLAASIAQNFDVADAQGRQLTGLEKLNALQGTAVELQDRIIAGAIRTGTSIDSFATAYRLVIPLSKDFGLSLDQSLNITESLVIAGRSLGLSLEAVKAQISQILSGHVTVRSVLARELFGGDATSILTTARAQGNLIELVTQKTEAYALSQKALAGTFAFVSNAAQIAGQVILKEVTSGGFEELKVALRTLVEYAVRFDEATKTFQIRPEFKTSIDEAKNAFRDFVLVAIDLSPLLVETFVFVAKSIADVVSGIGFAVEVVNRARAEGLRQEGESKAADAQQTLASLKLDTFPALEKSDPGLRQRRLAEAAQLAKDSSDAFEKAKELQDDANLLRQARHDKDAAASAADRAVANIEAIAKKVRAAIDAENAKPKPGAAPSVTVTPQSPDQRQGDVIAAIRLAAERELLEIGEKEVVVAEDRSALEGRRSTLTAAEYERAVQILNIRRAELELASANVRVSEAARILAVKGPADKEVGAQAAGVLLRNQLAAIAARERLNKAIEDTSHLTKAEEADLAREAALEASAVKLANTERLAVAESEVLDVERQSLAVRRATIDTNYAERQAAESRVVLATAELAVMKARLKLQTDEAELARQVTILNSPTANAEQRNAAQLAADRALEEVIKDRLAVSLAVFNVSRQTTLEFEKQTEAVRRSVEEMGGLRSILSDVSDIASLFGGGAPKGLTQFIQGFEALGKVQANFVKTARQDFASVFGVKDTKANVQTFAEALKVAFTNFDGFKSLFKNGGQGIIDLAGSIIAPLASGIQNIMQGGTIGGLLGGAQIGQTLAPLLGVGGLYGAAIGAGIGTALTTHNPVLGALGGALGGGLIGFKIGGPIGAAIGAAIGGILGGFSGAQKKETDRIVKSITTAVNATVLAVTAGTSTIGKSIDELLKERASAVAQLSGRKGAGDKLKQITDQIDQAVAQLKAQQKQIFDQFQSQLRVLSLVPQIQSVGQAIETLNNNVKQFLDAGGSALDAQRYLAFSLQAIYRDTNTQLTSAQKTTIDLLQQEVDLQTQRAQIVKDANDQENQIRQSTGLVRVQSQAQTAGQQIAKVEADKKTQLDANQKQLDQLHAQTDGLAELFHLGTDEASLQAARLAIMKQQTAETILQIKALQDFLNLNAAAFAAAAKLPQIPGVTVPSLAGTNLTAGGPVFNFGAGSISINAGLGTTPQTAFQQFIDGVRAGVGSSGWRLSAVR